MEDKSFFSGDCPNCGTKVLYHNGDNSVTCPACDQVVNVRDLFSQPKVSRTDTLSPTSMGSQMFFVSGDMGAASMSGQKPEGQLAYLDNIFEMYDWESFKKNSSVEFEDIQEFIKNTKLQYANDANTWLLEFKSVATPISKKLEALKEIGASIAQDYTGKDDTKLLDTFDLYSRIVRTLVSKRDYFIKLLSVDIKNAEKYKAQANDISDLKKQFEDISDGLKELNVVQKLKEIPEVASEIEEREKGYIQELASKGVDAVSTYNQAVESFMFDSSKERALRLFEMIPDFRDSYQYLDYISRWFYFEDYCEVAGVGYAIQASKNETQLLNMKNLKKDPRVEQDDDSSVFSFDLYEIKDNVPDEKPIVKGISQILTSYRGKLFYVEKNKNVCVFDGINKNTTVVISGKNGDFLDKNVSFNTNGDKLFLMKKLSLKFKDQKGCKFSKKAPETIVNFNNYEFVLIDMKNLTSGTAIDEMIDIIKISANRVFYKKSEEEAGERKTFTYVFNCDDNSNKKIAECEINAVYEDKLIYSTYKPVSSNNSLYVSDLITGETTLIEDNVFNYFGVKNGRIYYVIGARGFTTLISNNFEGTDRKQILTNVQNVIDVTSSWIFLLKGNSLNKALIKMSLDGEKSYVIASAIDRIVNVNGEIIYYIDAYDSLHSVRSDGKYDKVITTNMTGKTIVDGSNIYFTKRDELKDGSDKTISLYKLDMDGKNLKKIAFDVVKFGEYNENKLLVTKYDTVTIECKMPVKKNTYNTTITNYHVERYYIIDKYSEELKNVLTIGLPKLKAESVKVGCFKKKDVEYREIPYVPVYNTSIDKKAGSNFEEKSNELNSTKDTPKQQGCGANNKGKAVGGSNNNRKQQGCGANNKGKGNKSGCSNSRR